MFPVNLPRHIHAVHSKITNSITRLYVLIKYLTQSNNECDVFISCLKYDLYNGMINLSLNKGYPKLFPTEEDRSLKYSLSNTNIKFVLIDSIDHLGSPLSVSSNNLRNNDFASLHLPHNVIYINSRIYINHIQVNTFKQTNIKITCKKPGPNGEPIIIANIVYMLDYITKHIFNNKPRTHLKYILNNTQIIFANYNGTQFKLTKRLNISYNQPENIQTKENLHLCSMS